MKVHRWAFASVALADQDAEVAGHDAAYHWARSGAVDCSGFFGRFPILVP